MSSVTTSGASAWTFFSASMPLRAVPTTRNSSLDSTSSRTSLRMNALSSTTSTVWRPLEVILPPAQGAHAEAARRDVEIHAPPEVPADVLGHEGKVRLGERLPRRRGVSLAHVPASRGQERAEHARAADELGDDAP